MNDTHVPFRRSYGNQNLPSSIDAAEEADEMLTEKIQHIQAELATSNLQSIDPRTGEIWVREVFNEWRRRALKSMAIYTREKAFLKRWIRRERVSNDCKTISVDLDNPKSLIHGAHLVLKHFYDSGANLTDEEMKLMNTLRDYLHYH